MMTSDTRRTYSESSTAGRLVQVDSEVVDSDGNGCSFNASWETAFACPSNCIVPSKDHSEVSVCSGNGMCIADPAVGFVRCVCDELFEGEDCSMKVSDHNNADGGGRAHSDTGFTATIAIISILLVVFVVAVVYLYRRNKTLEKYAVPILDDHEQIEPRVPDYSDSDSGDFPGTKRLGGVNGGKEMVTMSTRIGQKLSATKNKMKGRSKYQAHNYDDSESDDDDDDYSDDGNNGPSAYLAANQGDDSDTE